mmetsp:Transcript_29419/g.71062  ORF Transcript_29419/g.71062 Transcript_29419/m.71062 type:complete len:160 (-) Transcript_29419:636-1115(-)
MVWQHGLAKTKDPIFLRPSFNSSNTMNLLKVITVPVYWSPWSFQVRMPNRFPYGPVEQVETHWMWVSTFEKPPLRENLSLLALIQSCRRSGLDTIAEIFAGTTMLGTGIIVGDGGHVFPMRLVLLFGIFAHVADPMGIRTSQVGQRGRRIIYQISNRSR